MTPRETIITIVARFSLSIMYKLGMYSRIVSIEGMNPKTMVVSGGVIGYPKRRGKARKI